MVLMQIAEPGASENAAEGPRKIGVGIDLGTTNSLIAHFDGECLSVLPDEKGAASLPSVVHYGQSGVIVGDAAVVMAAEHSADTIASAKRFMGKGRTEVSDDGYLEFADEGLAFATTRGPVTPVEVSADILRALASRASLAGFEQLDGAVITVPAYFDDAQRQATRQAADLAGLPVLRLLNEPTAAAVAYGLDSADEGVVAVYDLGGGTFDISILRLERGVFEVLATGGDSGLGGDDFDRLLANHLLAESGLSDLTFGQRRNAIACARGVKELLSEQTSCTVSLDHIVAGAQEVVVERSTLNDLCSDLINRSLDACRQCIADAGIEQVDRVVLVGGSTRMPSVREAVAALFGREPLTHIDPDQVVAMGAARQADLLVGNRGKDDLLLLDVIPLSLGVETYGGLVERLVHRNTTIPVIRAQEFTTARDGQTGLLVHVVQGERERVEDCRSLARFELSGIPPMVAGAARILVTFQVDADGLLEVSAKEESTGETTHVVVKPSFGLEDTTIAEMLRAGYENAGTDMLARQLTEARVDAEQLVTGIQAALNADGDLLDESERDDLLAAVVALEAKVDGDDVEVIRSAIEHAGKVSELFAARRMDRSIQQALGGISLETLEQEVGE